MNYKIKVTVFVLMLFAGVAQAAPTQINEGALSTISLNKHGLGLVLGSSQTGMPVGSIYDKERYYPEVQTIINKKIMGAIEKGFQPTGYETLSESQVYTLSRNNYELLLISGYTVRASAEKMQMTFIIPIERLLNDVKGSRIRDGYEYWKSLDVHTLDSLSESETRLK
ncbi:MAG: hypothetical protein KA715_13705 [Xanthomonadaceae bacterium]|nr:hypothetical protein [Xanthomonadaceae bacterium]